MAGPAASWLEAANRPDCDFPIQNLPYGIFSPASDPRPRAGIAIGDQVLDLARLEGLGMLGSEGPSLFDSASLNRFMAEGPAAWQRVRHAVTAFLSADADDPDGRRQGALHPLSTVTAHLPAAIGGYTDFYAARAHAERVGALFRGADKALPANWLHMPIAYNGRASAVVVSGTPVHRPSGQIVEAAKIEAAGAAPAPVHKPSARLDFELELAALIGVPSRLGAPVPVSRAEDHLFGLVLMNDWSARDIQQWEYVPLGPFNGKNFATTISPWVVPMAALAPFRVRGPEQSPAPLPYLRQEEPRGLALDLAAAIAVEGGAPETVSRVNAKDLYWSFAQQVAHHTVAGCDLRTGDLIGSGTISGPAADAAGCLLELTANGRRPVTLADGTCRSFLEDGDRVILTGHGQGDGYRVGFGAATGQVLAAVS